MMNRESRGEYALSCLGNVNFLFGMFISAMPIVTACLVMRYYHRPDMAFALHAQPYSRGKLFDTQIFTGWLMLIVPVVITGLIYMALSGSIQLPVYGNGTTGWEQAYTAGNVVRWIGESIALYTFYYALCVLAGALVGNTVTQILGSLVFYFVVPALTGIVLLYSESCLTGFDSASDSFLKIILYSEPLLINVAGAVDITLPGFPWYFAAGLIILLIAKLITGKAKLEKVGDSMIFGPVEAVVTVVISFIGGAILAILFGALFDDSFGMFLLGAVIGAAISFFIVKLILARTVRIFNGVNLKTFAASVIVLALFLMVFVTDITGFAGKVPADSKIASVNVKGVSENVLRLNDYDMYDSEGVYFKDKVFTDDREFIEKVTALQRYVAENKLYDMKGHDNEPSMDVRFEYVLNNGKTFSRFFTIRVDETAEKMLRDIVNDEKVTEIRMLPEALKSGAVKAEFDIQVLTNGDETDYSYGEIPRSGRDDIIRFIDTYNDDKKDDVITEVAYKYIEEDEYYDEPASGETIYAYMNIYYDSTDSGSYDRYNDNGYEPCVRVGIGSDDAATLKLIEEFREKYSPGYGG